MAVDNVPPSVQRELSTLKQRVLNLERMLNDLRVAYRPEIVFSQSGPLALGSSPMWTRRESGLLVEVVALLRVPGSTDTSIDVFRNDTVMLTATIPAGLQMVRVSTQVAYGADQDNLHDEVTVVGAGAADLTMLHRFKR